MVIWDLLRDFFVQYIFGGTTSSGVTYSGTIGQLQSSSTLNNSNDIYFDIGNNQALTMSDYLSTTFTVITLIVFVVILFLFLKWLFKVVSGFILLK